MSVPKALRDMEGPHNTYRYEHTGPAKTWYLTAEMHCGMPMRRYRAWVRESNCSTHEGWTEIRTRYVCVCPSCSYGYTYHEI